MSVDEESDYITDSGEEDNEPTPPKRKFDLVKSINKSIENDTINFEYNDTITYDFIKLFKEKLCYIKNSRNIFYAKSSYPTLNFLCELINDYEISKFQVPLNKWKKTIEQMFDSIAALNIIYTKQDNIFSPHNCMNLIDHAYNDSKSYILPKNFLNYINRRRFYYYLLELRTTNYQLSKKEIIFIEKYEQDMRNEKTQKLNDIHKKHLERIRLLSSEQWLVLNYIFNAIFEGCKTTHSGRCYCYMHRPDPVIIRLEGSAGSGKTSIIFALNGFIQYSSKYSMTYLTPTNVLTNSIREKAGIDKINVKTIFKFILKALRYNYFELCKFFSYTTTVQGDVFKNVYIDNLDSASIGCKLKKFHIFVIDEVYMFSEGLLSFFLMLVRSFKSVYKNVTFIVILIGDHNQLKPYYEPIDLEYVEYKWLDDICKPIFLTGQFRYSEQYNLIMQKLLDTPDIQGENYVEYLKTIWPEKFNSVIKYKYPLDEVFELVDFLKEKERPVHELLDKFIETNIFKKVLNMNVFCFTNSHMHFYNLSLAVCIINQLILTKTYKHVGKIIVFNIVTFEKGICDRLMVLPLIRFFPYRLLTISLTYMSNFPYVNSKTLEHDLSQPVPRLSIVYLIDWKIKNNEIEDLIVYSPVVDKFFTITKTTFYMNLYQNNKLFGFPLQMAFGSTFHSSQGLTLSNDIIVSLSNISKAELYVILSRIKHEKQLKAIF
ncbi:helicase-2-like protein [Glossina pallidipes salivary gland hypertrophy virus]|uniref:Helicase-2-like protein n=1 Tax=Glossina hytrovirus (isolate Glossina pallidipes/Ethiopia/Seibersdorf/-) TaxID=379529 RepID=B0YLM8_GHVS|nr:helicase-2-like protein [Glossina pallidipes salivary gland hypertrophy virus]ABQ08847.1 helicase-2-like protein [Glossina pallidipes salivary gland hypertrophy virus]